MPSPVLRDQAVSSSSTPGVTAAAADSASGGEGDAEPSSTAGDQQEYGEEGDGEECAYPAIGYEYLDHPADVQLHGWGTSLPEAFEQTALAMFGYMTDLDTVEAVDVQEITAQGHDMESMLFHFLDEWLFLFSAEPFFVASHVEILEFDRQEFRVRARGYGEPFDLDKHPQGTEVKAVTYSNLQVHDLEDRHEVFVIIDI